MWLAIQTAESVPINVAQVMNHAEKILSEPVTARDAALSYFECLPVPALLLASNGDIVAANAASHALLGAAPGELAGRSAALHFPELWSGSARSSAELADSDPPRRVTARRADGSSFPARLRFANVAAPGAAQFMVSIEDLADFERQLGERAAEVVAANREFEKFIDVAAHDLRAPLRILTGFADALDDETSGSLGEDAATFLKEIRTAGARMEGIIDGLLSLARSGRAEMHCESLDLTTLVELIYYELRHSGTPREVDCRVAPDLNGWGDVRLMMTALRAIIGNAWKFTGRTPAGDHSFLFRRTRRPHLVLRDRQRRRIRHGARRRGCSNPSRGCIGRTNFRDTAWVSRPRRSSSGGTAGTSRRTRRPAPARPSASASLRGPSETWRTWCGALRARQPGAGPRQRPFVRHSAHSNRGIVDPGAKS